jgi:hypothetical protein
MRDHIWTWIAALALATGVAALVCEHFQLPRATIFDMRALFGLAAAASITAVLVTRARAATPASESELYLYTRLVSRWVYILMYSLALVRIGLYILEADQSYISPIAHHRIPAPRPLDDFQFYVTCCIAPLWLVRALVLKIPFDRR